jgi:3-methyladenine DNA glycosylase AlkC
MVMLYLLVKGVEKMAEALKNMYNTAYFKHFSGILKEAYPEFNETSFIELIFDQDWENKELKQRIRHISAVLCQTLPASYPSALQILMEVAPSCRGFESLFFPDFVEAFGLDPEHWDMSISALETLTPFSSSEFAVRPFIQSDPDRMMAIMLRWAEHEDHHVRRLASEGCRPRLPWAAPLKALKADPSPVIPILTLLKEDSSEYVRKSVANHLNDISKDHPALVKQIASDWKGKHTATDWIIKHGCRTLLKRGDHEVLTLFGLETSPKVEIKELTLSASTLAIGDSLNFTFSLNHTNPNPYRLRVEYAIDFVKANGSISRKLFKITENIYKQGTTVFNRTQRFQNLSTRKHYAGKHRITIVINGQEMAEDYFQLTNL